MGLRVLDPSGQPENFMQKKYKIFLLITALLVVLFLFSYSYLAYLVSHSPSVVGLCTADHYFIFLYRCLLGY